MTDKKQPEAMAFCWATELAMTQQPVTLSVTEAREVSAEMQRLHAENTALQQGYAAARMEIESLQARIKTMAEEHADELMVAHMAGRSQAAQQPAPSAAVEVLDALNWVDDFIARCNGDDRGACESVNVLRRAFASHGQAPAVAACESRWDQSPCKHGGETEGEHFNARCRHIQGETRYTPTTQPAPAATRQPAPQQEVQEPVAWYVTGCGRLLDEDEAKAEARRIGGTARAMPLYTAPQADSVLEDAARLDWLALAGPTSICVVIDREYDGEVEVSTDDVTCYGKTLREALDKARKQGASHD